MRNQFFGFRRELGTATWTLEADTGILPPPASGATANTDDFVAFVSPDGSVVLWNTWVDAGGVVPGRPATTLAAWDFGCSPVRSLDSVFGVPDCVASGAGCASAGWTIEVVTDVLRRVNVFGLSDTDFLTAGPVPLAPECDPDPRP